MKILLIEDSKTLQKVIGGYLTDYGAQVFTTECGEQGLQLLERQKFDLVICDVDMPGLDGLETVPIIREFFGDKWVPIIFITGRESVDDFVKGIEAGADDFIVKPVNKQVLHAKLRVLQRFILMQQEKNQLIENSSVLANKDPFTQIYTRESLIELAEIQWSTLLRQKLPMSCLIVAINDFKAFKNHYTAETLLSAKIQISSKIKSILKRAADTIGLWDEGKFIILLPDTQQDGSYKVAGLIESSIKELQITNLKSKRSEFVTVSIGGSTCAKLKGFSLATALTLAEDALEKALRIKASVPIELQALEEKKK